MYTRLHFCIAALALRQHNQELILTALAKSLWSVRGLSIRACSDFYLEEAGETRLEATCSGLLQPARRHYCIA
jgi:hypothetical protein